jgi:Cdc6-like AAA superfamily ATPase
MLADPAVFTLDYLPSADEIRRRDGELDALTDALEDPAQGYPCGQTHLSGPAGAGKTMLARRVVRNLGREFGVETHYINCWSDHETTGVLEELARGLGHGPFGHSTPTRRYKTLVRQRDEPYVVILDEVDQLDDQDVLYLCAEQSHVHLVLVSNDYDDHLARLESRVASRIRPGRHVRLAPYGPEDVVAILRERARAGLDGPVATDVLEEIAVETRNCRLAIRTLYEAAREAGREGAGRVPAAHVETAIPMAREELRQRALSSLTRRQRRVYQAVEEQGPCGMGDLYQDYRSRSGDPASRSTVRRELTKLAEYDLVKIEGEKRGREYRALGE